MKRIPLLFLFVIFSSVSAQEEVDLMDLIKEIQQVKKVDSNMKMVWWIPTEYWRISTKGSPLVTEEGLNQLLDVVAPFTIVAALDGDIGLGTLNYKDSLNIILTTEDDNIFLPLNNDEIPMEVKNVLRSLKPVLVNMIGDMGKNLNLFVFSNSKDSGDKVISPGGDSDFNIVLNEEIFKWQLPLNSFVPKKKCPIDDLLMTGNWKFCPWHGEKLINQNFEE